MRRLMIVVIVPIVFSCGGGGGGSVAGGNRERLTVWFEDGSGYQLQSDGQGTVSHPNCGGVLAPCYIDGEQRVIAHIHGDPGGISLSWARSPRGITLDLTNDCESAVAGFSCDEILPNELKGLVQPSHVTARAYTHNDSPQLIPVMPAGQFRNYRLRVRVPINGKRWLIELGSIPSQPPGTYSNGTRCPETGQDVTVTGLEDTDNDGLSDKWLVTAVPVTPEGEAIYNARVCTISSDGTATDLVARLKMTFQYTAQLK